MASEAHHYGLRLEGLTGLPSTKTMLDPEIIGEGHRDMTH
jgi:hypothetical protein